MNYFKRSKMLLSRWPDINKRIFRPATLGCIVCGILASLLFALVLIFAEAPDALAAPKTRIKFSTLAPEGSSWMKAMRSLEKELQRVTEGEVGFKFYPGGVSGDEIDVIRKMRIGQIHAAGFTGVGLGEILPEVRVLDLPFLFRNDREIEVIYEKNEGLFHRPLRGERLHPARLGSGGMDSFLFQGAGVHHSQPAAEEGLDVGGRSAG